MDEGTDVTEDTWRAQEPALPSGVLFTQIQTRQVEDLQPSLPVPDLDKRGERREVEATLEARVRKDPFSWAQLGFRVVQFRPTPLLALVFKSVVFRWGQRPQSFKQR